ncbi:MAG: DUF5060 domain-containing protein [Phycisphaerae bacterium]|nr:DUF5060 domain-containing protein [Phycisphaerae bacterium]
MPPLTSASRTRLLLVLVAAGVIVVVCPPSLSAADDARLIIPAEFGDSTTTMWAPTLEWTLPNDDSYDGNPFDLVARVTFTRKGGGTRVTEMFYAGDDAWKFRFTGTRTGTWTFTTQADGNNGTTNDPELHGRGGTITVKPNPNARMTGFLTSQGTKYAVQVGNDAHLEGFRFNAFMHGKLAEAYDIEKADLFEPLTTDADRARLQTYLDTYVRAVAEHGCNAVFQAVHCRWFEMDPDKRGHDRLDDRSDNASPDPRTFERLEMLWATARQHGLRVHLWAWGDEARKWTPIGVGGLNGVPDRRLQRYIAARLGPLPGWTMGYGFDLQEWTKEEDLRKWAAYLHEHFGWQHMLWGRGRSNEELDVKSYSGYGVKSYDRIVKDLASDPDRPHLYEERDSYRRPRGGLTQDGSRRFMWNQTLAGGIGGFWGHYSGRLYKGEYPNPEQFACCREFWRGRFLLEMERAEDLTDGHALATPDGKHYAFYKPDAERITLDLSKASGTLRAVAVDATKAYREIDLGRLKPGKHTWKAPRKSDWAIAVGVFPTRDDED